MDGSLMRRNAAGNHPARLFDDGRDGRPSRRRPIIAVIAMLAVLFTVLVPANAALADLAYSGTADVNWSKTSSTTASGTLPGNLASLPGATVTVSSSKQPLEVGVWGASYAASHTDGGSSTCLQGKAVKQIATCETFTYTVNLKTPLIDPIVPFGFTTGRYWSTTESTLKGCISGWYDGALSTVNGSTTTSSSFSMLQEPGGGWTHTGTATWALPQSSIDANTCVHHTTTDQMGIVQLKGKISSYSFTVYYRSAIVIPWTTTVCPLLSAPAGQFVGSLLVPQVDLAVTKIGPSTVAGNGTITWDISVKNLSQWNSHGFVIKDAVPANVTNPSIVSAPAGCSVVGKDLVCSVAPPGCTVSQNTSVTTLADISCSNATAASQVMLAAGSSFGPVRLAGTAPVTNGTTISNTATVSGVDADPVTSNNTSKANTTVVQAPKLTIAKQAALAPGATGKAGDTVNYTFTATNAGNVTLTGVTIADPLPGLSGLTYAWPGAAGTLQAGQSVTATATYRLTQADVDAGAVSNVATATGRDPGGSTVDGGKAPATVTLNPRASLTMTKNGALAPGATGKAGDTVNYTFSATNTGDVSLNNVAIADPHAGLSAIVYQWPGQPGVLAPGQKVTATATYIVTQADMDAGVVNNTATAAGRTPNGTPVDGGRASVSIPLNGTPKLSLTKTAKLAVGAQGAIGDRVEYTFTATNTGSQTLTNVTIVDQLAGMSSLAYQWPGASGVLAPGQSVTATATYTLAQKDIDAGSVNNVATASGTAPNGSGVPSGPAQATVPLTVNPELTLTKTAALAAGQSGVAGDRVQYTFTVTNTGRVTVNGTTVSDKLVGLSAPVYQWPGAPGVLAPGQRVTATATYTITQADVDSGSVSNVATANGTTPSGQPVKSNDVPATVPLAKTASLNITKTAALAAGQTGRAGDTVNYTFSATNTGPTTLTGVTISDPLPGLSGLTYSWPGAAGTLKPGQKVTATATYTVKQADVDSGAVSNVASSSGRAPDGTPVDGGRAPATVPLAHEASLDIHKTATLASGATGKVGDKVNYTFSATNTGPTTLTNVAITDPLPGLSALVYAWPGTAGTLKPGQAVTATATYTVKQSDVDAGAVSNVAASAGRAPDGTPVDGGRAPATVPLAQGASLNVTKVAKLGDGATGKAGDTITYTFSATNTGPTTLNSVSISDPLPGLSALVYSWPGTAGVLAPGQKVTATATYLVKQADVDSGSVSNVASSAGKAPDGSPVDGGRAPATVPLDDDASLNITKTAALTAGQAGKAGDTVNYTFSATNTGPTTLTNVVITDPLPGLSVITYAWPGPVGTLKPGQKVTATANYTVRQADVDAGAVSNVASSAGTAPDGSPVDGGRAPATVPLTQGASLNITKVAALGAGQAGKAGDTVTYTFSATNTGPTTLTEVVIADPLPGLSALSYSWPAEAGKLAPGQKVTATATYTVKQSDVDAGSISNVASSGGRAPDGKAVDGGKAPATVPLAQGSSLNITKTGALATGQVGKAGDTVNYTFSATNTGVTTLTNVVITDPLPGLSGLTYTWPGVPGTLKPGQTVTAKATYTVTQDDADAGAVSNVAASTGTAPDGSSVDGGKAPATVPLGATPTLSLHKEIAGTTGGSAGDVVTYRFTSKNTGALTLQSVVISDPLDGLSAMTYQWPGADGILKPGESVVATATYVIKQSDVDAGGIWNTAVSHGSVLGRMSRSLVNSNESLAELPLGQTAQLELTKTGALAAGSTGKAGDTVDFAFTIENSGSTTVSAISIADQLAGLSNVVYQWPAAAGVLTPGQTATAAATYSVKQADVDAGSVTNVATVAGTAPSGDPVTDGPVQATVPLAQGAQLTLTKTGALAAGAAGAAGDTIAYAFEASNAGQVTLHGVSITDQLAGLSTVAYSWPGAAGVLSPGQKATATATYTVKQADIDAGKVDNLATATGLTPSGATVPSAPATASVPLEAEPGLTITKSGALASGATGTAGDRVNFQFTVGNSGATTLTGVSITDQLPGVSTISYTWPGAAGTLTPGQTAQATATYALTQSDVDAGKVTNVAIAHGTDPSGNPVDGGPAQVVVPIAAKPGISVVKTGALATGSTGKAGDTVNFTFTATNTGNSTLTAVSIADQLAGVSVLAYSWPGAAGTLAPAQKVTATATYTLTQADVDAGKVTNVAVPHGTAPDGSPVDGNPAQTVVPVKPSPALTLVKTGALAAGATGEAGDGVTFGFTVTNTGTVTATGVVISDQLTGVSAIAYTWPGAAGVLTPGQAATGTATYTLKQADVDAGSVLNVATATGTAPDGAPIPTGPAQATVPLQSAPALTLVKTGALAAGATGKAGDSVTFGFTVTNSGTVTATGVSIADQLTGVSVITYTWPGAAGTLAPGQKVTATASYTLKQADVDAGSVLNVATATGRAPDGAPIPTGPAQAAILLEPAPALTLVKTGALAAGATGKAGDSVKFSFTVTNSGTVTATGVSIADQQAGVSAIAYSWPGAAGTLAPGQSATATASYTLKQADVDAGSVLNVATPTGRAPDGAPIPTGPAQATVPLQSAPALTLVKTGALAAGATGKAGDSVKFSFTVTNSGTVTANGVSIADQLAGVSAITYTWPGAVGTLAPGQKVTATASYTLKQADVDAGSVLNVATATGRAPDGAPIPTGPAQAAVPLEPAPALTLVKTGALAAGATGVEGDAVTFTFTVTNSGTVTATGVSIADRLPGVSALAYTWPGAAGTLAPGQSATATASYTLTQADVDAGSVKNVAAASGTSPDGSPVTSPDANAVVPVAPAPGLTLVKTGALAPGATGKAGDLVEFAFTVTNSGSVTDTQVSIADRLTGLSAITYTWPGAAGTLAPGQSATATASYALTQADVDAGSVKNVAAASGVTPNGSPVTSPDADAVVPVAPAPALTLVKTGALAAGAVGKAGDAVTFTFTVTNSGTVTATDVTIADRLPGVSAITYSWPATPGTLAPGQTATATATYKLAQADVDAGSVKNVAAASGTSPDGSPITSPDAEAVVPVAPAPALTLVKTGALAAGATGKAGDVVEFAFTVTNSGSVTDTQVSITDELAGLSAIAYTWPGPAGTLAPGQSATATASYPLTQADVDAGSVKNIATAAGRAPDGSAVAAPPAQVVVPINGTPALTLTKTGELAAGATGAAGDRMGYTFVALNTGTVTLTGVAIADPMRGLSALVYEWPGAAGVLAPGQQVSATAVYTLTQADVDAGSVANLATATAADPGGDPVAAPPAQEVVPLVATPGLSIVKTGALADVATGVAGDRVDYSFTIRNTGSVTLRAVTIADQLAGLSAITYSWPDAPGVLAPDATATAAASYTLTQADVDAGSIANVATATGTAPDGSPVPATPSESVVPLSPAPGLTVAKKAALASGAVGAVGDVVNYTITVTNTGGVTLTAVSVSDDLAGLTKPEIAWPGEPGVLAPAQSATATAAYTITQADVDAGSVANVATGAAVGPKGETVPAQPSEAVVPLDPGSGLLLTKSAALADGADGEAGDSVVYTFALTNTGGVTLTGVAVSDRLAGLGPVSYNWPGAAGVLAPGQTVSATAAYAITAADVAAGSVSNVATASGATPGGAPVVTPEAPATLPLPSVFTDAGTPGIGIAKAGSLAEGATGQIGDLVFYTFTVSNTGSVPLTSVSISDPLDGISSIDFGAWPGTPGQLQPGEAVTATATYALTAADVTRGSVENTAWTRGVGDGQEVKSGSNTVALPVPHLDGAAPAAVPAATGILGDGFTVLAHTGLDALPIGLGALALLLGGWVALVLRRRTRQS